MHSEYKRPLHLGRNVCLKKAVLNGKMENKNSNRKIVK